MSTINQQDAQHVLFHFSPATTGACQPGSFTAKLLEAYSAADYVNRSRLARGFPSLAAAFEMAVSMSDGLEQLSVIATGGANVR